MLFFTKIQCITYINAQPDHFPLCHPAFTQNSIQRFEQLHADINIIANSVWFANYFIIFYTDDIRSTFQILHQFNLRGVFPGNGVVIALALGTVHSFRK